MESRSKPRLQNSGDGEMVQQSVSVSRAPVFQSRALRATTKNSVLLLLILSRLDDLYVLTSCRKLTSDWGGNWVEGFVLR